MDTRQPTAATERDWEGKFRNMPDPTVMRNSMQRLSARPHHVGSPYDKENAEWLLAQFKQCGFDAHIETFDVLFPTPKERAVELIAPTKFIAKLQEPPLPVDPTSNRTRSNCRTYNAYSIDGDVTAPLVYVNYGVPRGLRRTRSPGHFRERRHRDRALRRSPGAASSRKWPPSMAPSAASSIPIRATTATCEGDVFPRAPMRPPDGVQRGSVMDSRTIPAIRSPRESARPKSQAPGYQGRQRPFTKIPVLPISYGDAQPLLAALAGPVAPDGWRGALPITYHVGPGPAKVHLEVKSNWDMQADLRRDRADSRQRHAGRMGDSRQSPRRLGERRG